MNERGYLICTAPRSGSNLLCQLLWSTGSLGRPREYFNGAARHGAGERDYPEDALLQAHRVISEGRTSNGVYGAKVFPWQFTELCHAEGAFRVLRNLRFIRLGRRDRLRQAISWLRARQTGQYQSKGASTGECRYDAIAIGDRIREIALIEATWDAYFARTAQAPLSLWYEDIEASPERVVASVASFLDLPSAHPDRDVINVKIQRDALTEEWHTRFLSERGCVSSIELFCSSD